MPRRLLATRRNLALTLALTLAVSTSGCVTILEGVQETVIIGTQPPGQTVYIGSQPVQDGESVVITKEAEVPKVRVETPNGPYLVKLKHEPNPLIIADAALLIVFVVPGLVALGVDFATGAWRDLDEVQIIHVPGGSAE